MLGILPIYIAAGFVVSLTAIFMSFESILKLPKAIVILSNLTLEMYLWQFMVIQAFNGTAFPSNITLCIMSILGISYVANTVSKCILSFVGRVKINDTRASYDMRG